MEQLNIALATISLLIITTALVDKKLELSIIAEPMLAVGLGIILGPAGLALLDFHEWGKMEETLMTACRFTIAMALMSAALQLPRKFPLQMLSTQTWLVLGGMLGMWVISSLIFYLLFHLSIEMSLLLGAIITPTDPVVAVTMVSGKAAERYLPGRIRNSLSFEASINDGLALPFVMLPLLLLMKPEGALKEWFLKGILWETLGGLTFGLAIGYVAGKLLHKAHKNKLTTEKAILSYSIALAFAVLGLLDLIKVNSILGVFAAGYMLRHEISHNEDIEEEKVQEMTERIFTIPIFVLFGLILPWNDWFEMGWKAIALIAAVHLFRRLPVIWLMKPLLRHLPLKYDLTIVGWFGPIGVAALYYAAHVIHKGDYKEVWPYVSLVVFSSVIIHGITSYPLSKWYGKKASYEGDTVKAEE